MRSKRVGYFKLFSRVLAVMGQDCAGLCRPSGQLLQPATLTWVSSQRFMPCDSRSQNHNRVLVRLLLGRSHRVSPHPIALSETPAPPPGFLRLSVALRRRPYLYRGSPEGRDAFGGSRNGNRPAVLATRERGRIVAPFRRDWAQPDTGISRHPAKP
jgi:hypothetical protein